jgi:HAD superfamily hydrolase (TIGR01509 family)
MSRPPRLVIFDCDGVLVDSEPISAATLAGALTTAGLPISPSEALLEYKGRLLSDIMAQAESRLGAPLPAGFSEAFEGDRAEAFARTLKAIPGAQDTVRSITAAGVSVCVASQGKLEKTELTLSLTGLRQLFGEHALFSADMVARGKPNPDLFLHAAERMGATPDECVVVEDTAIGIIAAVAAGMRAVAYAADGDPVELQRAGAETVQALSELPALIGL